MERHVLGQYKARKVGAREKGAEALPFGHYEQGIDSFSFDKVVHNIGIHVGCIGIELEERMIVACHQCSSHLKCMRNSYFGLVFFC